MTGSIHNAKLATIDGRDLWIAVICDDRGRFLVRTENVTEHDTPEAARAWLTAELRARGYSGAKITERKS